MIKNALKSQAIRFERKVATKSHFEEMVAQAPLVLHISCHGVQNVKKTMQQNYEAVKEEGHFLLFETNEGAGELVSAKHL